jgi:hypothetical protein
LKIFRVDVHYTASLDGCQCIEVEAASEAEAREAALHAFDRHAAWEETRHESHFRLVAEAPEEVAPPKPAGKRKRSGKTA